jgi:two-component system sensor histidine kinase QseC
VTVPALPRLTRQLTAWVLGALALVWATFIFVGYWTGQHEADELTDGHLASAAALMLAYSGDSATGVQPQPPVSPAAELRAHDYQQSMSVVLWDRQGRVLARSGAAPLPAFDGQEGFATLQLGEPAEGWRAFSRWDTVRGRKVMVLLSLQERESLAQDIAEQVIEPGLWLLPVVALALGLAIRRGLRPLYQLSRDVRAIDIHRPRQLAPAHHEELQSAVEAINALVAGYHAALTRERELAGEFAHELRTPLASLALQARNLAGLPEGPERVQAQRRLEQDALRAGEVLSHLLAMARAQRAQLEEAARPVELYELARDLVAEFAPAAHATRHSLGLSGRACTVQGHAVLLELALRNLLENALSHTPSGTDVDVQVAPEGPWIQVCSREPGHGEPPQGGSALGLGLGHRVVQKIAEVHGARFEPLEAAPQLRYYRLSFPKAD